MRKVLLLSLMLSAPMLANAKIESDAKRHVNQGTILNVEGSFDEQRERILSDLATGEKYSEISQQQQRDVRSALDRITREIESNGSIDTLSAEQRLKVFNDQELVNTILTRAGEDSRLVCKREKSVSTRIASTQCLTVAQRRKLCEEAQDHMRKSLGGPTLEQSR
jgi:phosphomevalonate kinase